MTTQAAYQGLMEHLAAVSPTKTGPIARRMETFDGLVGTLKHMGKTATDEHWNASEILGGLHVVLQRVDAILAEEDG